MDYVAIATITKPHGVEGAVSVKTDSDFKEERYAEGNRLYILHDGDYIPVTIATHAVKKNRDILVFDEFDTIEEVQRFRNCDLYVAEKDREPLGKDEFYASDLIGLPVLSNHQVVGTVKSVRHYPQGEVLVIEREGMKDAFVPFRKEFVGDVSERGIVIDDREGLL